MPNTPIFDDDRIESPDEATADAAAEQIFPTSPVTDFDASEADVLDQAREEPLGEEPRE